MQFVLRHREKVAGNFRPLVVIGGGCVNVFDLLVKILFRGPDVPDARQQFVKIRAAACFQPLIIQGKAFDDKLSQPLGGPNAKLLAAQRLNPVTNRDDDIQVVIRHLIDFAVKGSPIKAGVNKKKVVYPRFLFGFFGRFERPLPS